MLSWEARDKAVIWGRGNDAVRKLGNEGMGGKGNGRHMGRDNTFEKAI